MFKLNVTPSKSGIFITVPAISMSNANSCLVICYKCLKSDSVILTLVI